MAKKINKTIELNNCLYNYNDPIDYKKYLSVSLIQSQIDSNKIEEILKENRDKLASSGIEFNNEEDDDGEDYFTDDLFTAESNYELTEDEIKIIHEIVDYNLPQENFPLKNEYISEGVLRERENGTFDVTVYNPSKKKDENKTYTKQREDLIQYVTAIEDTTKRTIYIDYNKLLEIDNLDKTLESEGMVGMFEHHLQQKSFQGLTDKIVNDYNFILNEYKELGVKLFKFRTRMAIEGKNYNVYNFLIDCIEIINDNKFRSIIKAMDDSTYAISLDNESINNSTNIIEDLRVTDKCNKVILQAAIMCRIFVPIINEYAVFTTNAYNLDHNGKKYMINHLNIIVFKYILRYISLENDVNIINKLYKIIEPRVKATNYSDKVMWALLESHVIDDDTVINSYMKRIIRTIIAKIDVNRSSISFLDVVVRNMINSEFYYKFTYSNKVIRISSSDDDDTNELDKVALTKYHRFNELEDIIVEATINNFIDRNLEKYGIENETLIRINNYLTSLNEFQIALIKIYYDSIFPSLSKCTTEQLIALIAILKYKMKNERFFTLTQLILSKRSANTDISKTGRIPKDITSSESYKNIRDKFKTLLNKFDKDAYLLKLTSVYNFDFNIYDPETDEEYMIYSREMDRKEIASELFEYTLNCIC